MLLAAGQQGSFRYTSTQIGCACGADERVTQVTDVAATEGSQRITVSGNGQTGHVTVLVTGGSAYLKGDAFALTTYMGFKAASVPAYAGRWIQIPPTDHDFTAVAMDVTLMSSLSDIVVPAPLTLTPMRALNGSPVLGVTGTKRATAKTQAITVSLYGRATGLRLPVEEDTTMGRYSARMTFGRWHEPLHVAVPAGATPIAATGLE